MKVIKTLDDIDLVGHVFNPNGMVMDELSVKLFKLMLHADLDTLCTSMDRFMKLPTEEEQRAFLGMVMLQSAKLL